MYIHVHAYGPDPYMYMYMPTDLTPDGSDLVVELCLCLLAIRVALLVYRRRPRPSPPHAGTGGEGVGTDALVHEGVGDGDHREEMLSRKRAREIPTNVIFLIECRNRQCLLQDRRAGREGSLFAHGTQRRQLDTCVFAVLLHVRFDGCGSLRQFDGAPSLSRRVHVFFGMVLARAVVRDVSLT